MPNLIVYFSRTGQNFCNGTLKNLTKGNTEKIAEFIQRAVGGDTFKVETVKEYSDDYETCIEETKRELYTNARPELKQYLDGVDKYDAIFVGYPSWWGSMPMAMYTFLERYDLTGKKILPFCTNEGSGMGISELDLANVCKGAKVLPGISIHGAEAALSERVVTEWAKNSLKAQASD